RRAPPPPPGGSRAFATAVDNLEVDFRRILTERWTLDVIGMATRDAGPILGESRNHYLVLGQQYQLGDRTSVRLRASTGGFATHRPGLGFGRFGSSQHSLTGGAQFRLRRWDVSTDLRVGILGRETQLFSGAMSELRVAQQEAQVTLSRGFDGVGHLTTGGGALLTGDGMGMPREALNAFVGIGGVSLPLGPQTVRLHSRLSYIASSVQAALVTAQLSAVTTLPGGLDLMATVERNPFFRDRLGRATWMGALRLTASTTVFVPRQLKKVSGVVYEDLNGNGRRDVGEAGVAGVVLRQAGIRIVSEENGVYRLPANLRGRLQVDPLGLPDGFVPSPQFSRDLTEQRDIPLVQTGSMTVILALAADPDGRLPDVDLAKAQVWLRDALGNDWVGRASGAGEYAFENVPAGRYSFRFDLSRLAEPLRSEDGLLAEVAPRDHRSVTVTLRGRNVRLIVPPTRSERDKGGTGRGGRRALP
ncbi:MAG: hypothetical protein WD771_07955, partial [Gemmatimonadaceae bacterium]